MTLCLVLPPLRVYYSVPFAFVRLLLVLLELVSIYLLCIYGGTLYLPRNLSRSTVVEHVASYR